MKKILLFVLVAVAAISMNAQDVYMAGNVSMWRNDDANTTSFKIAPEIGYNLSEEWSIGSEFGYMYDYVNKSKTNTFSVAPYARYSYYNNGSVRLFLDGGFGFSTTKVKGHDSENGYQIGLKPGIAVKLNDHFSVLAKVGFIGYNDDYGTVSSRRHGFGFDLNGDDLSLGIHYAF